MGIDKGVAHERAAIMAQYTKQAKVITGNYARVDYSKRLSENRVATLDLKPGGRTSSLYSNNKLQSSLDSKFAPIDKVPYNAKPENTLKVRLYSSDSGYSSLPAPNSSYTPNNLSDYGAGMSGNYQ